MNVGAFTNFDQVISFLDAEDPKPKTRTIDHILLALPLVLDVTPETELPFTQVSEQPAPTPLETDNLTTQVLRQSIEELNKAVDIMVKRRNLDLKALRIMAWTANTSTVRPQALHPETTAPAPAVFAAAPATNVNTVFDPNDSASSFFLHPNENPSLVLISEVLNGRNYHPWARAMEMALLSKNKLGFVDGTVAMPDVNDIKFPYWKRCNNMVSAWITRSLLPEIAQTVLWAGTAERIWKTLKSRFSEADIFRVSNLHAEIHQTPVTQALKPSIILPTATHLTEEPPPKYIPRLSTTSPSTSAESSQPNDPSTHSEPSNDSHNDPPVSESQTEPHQQQVRRRQKPFVFHQVLEILGVEISRSWVKRSQAGVSPIHRAIRLALPCKLRINVFIPVDALPKCKALSKS
nr:uncharacterized protein LOC109168309 [Ipomoea batatas]